jgi:eukaryotic-like serine/threonine-protein kinase
VGGRVLQQPESDPETQLDQAIAEYLIAEDSGTPLNESEWFARFPTVADRLRDFLDDHRQAAEHLSGWGQAVDAMVGERSPPLDETIDHATAGGSSVANHTAAEAAAVDHRADGVVVGRSVGGIRLGHLLGSGGMGEVYHGVDSSGRAVAVKMLSSHRRHSRDSLERFKLEGAVASSVNHPRCVFVHAADEDHGQPYIVMELMSGETLRDLVKREGPLPIDVAVSKTLDVAEGLREAHHHGMIHRDVKPGNCYLEESGRVKVGDFGLARLIMQDAALTSTGIFVGTPQFASPEQIRGEPLDPRTDVYSLCATLYCLLTGRPPHEAPNATQTIARIVSQDPLPPRQLRAEIPEALERVVLKGLNRQVDQRFRNMEQLIAALKPFLRKDGFLVNAGRRLAAYSIDLAVGSLPGMLWTVLVAGDLDTSGRPGLGLLTVSLVAWFAYFAVGEVRWGCSLGKWLIGLRVVDHRTNELPSSPRMLARTGLFLLVSGWGTAFVVELASGSMDVLPWAALQYAVMAISVLGMLSTFPIRGQRRLLHDWLTQTCVISTSLPDSSQAWDAPQPQWAPALESAGPWPSQVGRYRVKQGREGGDGSWFLLGEDPGLERDVWLLVGPAGSNRLFESEAPKLARTSRLRRTDTGWLKDRPWLAVVAPDGAPLPQWVTATPALTWPQVRPLLVQWCDELMMANKDGSSVAIERLDQFWIDRRGRMVLLEPEVAELLSGDSLADESHLGDRATATSAGASSDPMLWTANWLRLALEGAAAQTLDRTVPIHSVVPMHARRTLDGVVKRLPGYQSVEELASDLSQHESRPIRVTHVQRLVHACIVILIGSFAFGAHLATLRAFNNYRMEDLAYQSIAGQVLVRMADRPAELQQLLGELGVEPIDVVGTAQGLLAAETQRQARLQARLASDRLYRRDAMTDAVRLISAGELAETPLELLAPQDSAVEVLIDPRPQSGLSLTLKLSPASDESVIELQRRGRLSLTADAFRQATEAAELVSDASSVASWAEPRLPRRIILGLYLLVFSPMIVVVIWDTIFRGGWALWLSGLRLTDVRGQPARRWRIALRSLAYWSLPMLLGLIISSIDLWWPSGLWLSTTLFFLAVCIPLPHAIWLLTHPEQSWNDTLAGTRVVPR